MIFIGMWTAALAVRLVVIERIIGGSARNQEVYEPGHVTVVCTTPGISVVSSRCFSVCPCAWWAESSPPGMRNAGSPRVDEVLPPSP